MQGGEMTADNCCIHSFEEESNLYQSNMQAAALPSRHHVHAWRSQPCPLGYQRTTEPEQVQRHSAALGKGIKHEASPE